MIKKRGTEFSLGRTAKGTKASGRKGSSMEMECFMISMDSRTLGNGIVVNKFDLNVDDKLLIKT